MRWRKIKLDVILAHLKNHARTFAKGTPLNGASFVKGGLRRRHSFWRWAPSGRPCCNKICNSVDAHSNDVVFSVGHHLSLPDEKRRLISQKPRPSYTRILTLLRLLFVKTKIIPENGSCFNTSLHTPARPSIPRRKSMGWTANKMVWWGVNWSMAGLTRWWTFWEKEGLVFDWHAFETWARVDSLRSV